MLVAFGRSVAAAALSRQAAFPSVPVLLAGSRALATKKKDSKKDDEPAVTVNIEDLVRPLRDKGAKSLEILQTELSQLRVGIASPSLLDSVTVSLSEGRVPLRKVAQVVVKDPQTLIVHVLDPAHSSIVTSSIQSAGLNLNPIADKNAIRVPVPRPTAEYRDNLAKLIEKNAEKCRVSVRNLRQAVLKDLSKFEKSMPKDDYRRAEKDIQTIVDQRMKDIANMVTAKTKEISR